MSARQRFVASGAAKPASKSPAGQAGPDPAIQTPSDSRDQPALKDASNSPRPIVHDNVQESKSNANTSTINSSGIQAQNSVLTSTGVQKRLNVGSLMHPKTKNGSDASGQKKTDRNPMADRFKENEPLSRSHSPRPLPLSPSRRLQNLAASGPHLFGPPNATLLTDNQPGAPIPHNRHPSRPADASSEHLPDNNKTHDHNLVTLNGNSFAASGHMLMDDFTASASHSFNQTLEPARREVFPMRINTDGQIERTHTFSSSSPLSPAQRLFPAERSYDYQAPISLGGSDDETIDALTHKHDQRVLRRATKRIDHHDAEEEFTVVREGKRSKLDTRSKEVILEQHIDLTYEHRGRTSRSSTPVHRHKAPTQVDKYHAHQPQEPPRPSPDAQAQNVIQFDEGNEALCRLLGDLERYVSEHLDKYEAAKKRWTSCTIEEWKAGAEEVSGKFSKLIDFVKDHMNTKLGLYVSLHEKVSQHKVTLDERRTVLKNLQEKLIKDSGAVLGASACGIN